MNMMRKCAVLVLAPLFGVAAMAASFPEKMITIVVPYSPGGTADMLARTAADILQKDLGQSVIVEYKPGAGGSTGLEYVARSHPDGYTLALTASGSVTINPYVYKLRYDPLEDLTPVTILTDVPFVFVLNNDFPAKNLADFRTFAQKTPGKVSSGNAGTGSQAHLTQVMFANAANIKLNIVGYKASPPALNDLLGGHIDTMIDNIAMQAPYINAGKVTALFVTTPKRSPVIPHVPTAQEAGLPGFNATAWFGLAAPKGTPADVTKKLQAAIAKGFEKPEIKKMFEGLGLAGVASTPAESQSRQKIESKKFAELAKQIGLQPQ